jgi:hypothetical protein
LDAKGPTVPLDVTPVRARGSLAVMQRLVKAVYGLNLVEASPTIYVILPLCVARVDQVGSGASVDLVVVFAGDDLVVAAATPDAVVAAAPPEVVRPAAALEAILPCRGRLSPSASIPRAAECTPRAAARYVPSTR